MFQVTKERQIALSMAYLCYTGEKLLDPSKTETPIPLQIFDLINKRMPTIPPLLDNGAVDWEIVWGPCVYTLPFAKLQDNMLFVTRQKSDPSNYVVATRGTNGSAVLDWLEEDFSVWEKVEWPLPAGIKVDGIPKISTATHTGVDALLNKMVPIPNLPGAGENVAAFLTKAAAAGKISVTFTGHSLGGALAPTLALWFKQSQHLPDQWDPAGNAAVTTIPFAGATAGDAAFAAYFNGLFGNGCDRIHNTLDIVPHAWQTSDLKELPGLYASAKIAMPEALKLVLDGVEWSVHDYRQVEASDPFDGHIDVSKKEYMEQALVQHVDAYPIALEVPQLLDDPF